MNKWSGFLAVGLLLCVSKAILALDLLESLETEGRSSVLDESGMAKQQAGAMVDQFLLIPKSSNCGKANQFAKVMVGGLSRRDFEKVLRRDHCATSLFYKKISYRARQQVYDAYMSGSDLSTLQEMILLKMQ
ncbi:MAG: hypothetical protein Q9N68_00505 [Gammaproteobacteria bacterium]|nr:hypothetical protein [Gammaproteobacteria bacterium]